MTKLTFLLLLQKPEALPDTCLCQPFLQIDLSDTIPLGGKKQVTSETMKFPQVIAAAGFAFGETGSAVLWFNLFIVRGS